jgi:hypothetical protein
VVASVKGYGSTPLTGDVSHDPSREAGGRTNLSQRNCDGAQANLSQIIRQNLLLNVLRRSFGYCYGDISSEVNVNVRVSSRRSKSQVRELSLHQHPLRMCHPFEPLAPFSAMYPLPRSYLPYLLFPKTIPGPATNHIKWWRWCGISIARSKSSA